MRQQFTGECETVFHILANWLEDSENEGEEYCILFSYEEESKLTLENCLNCSILRKSFDCGHSPLQLPMHVYACSRDNAEGADDYADDPMQ